MRFPGQTSAVSSRVSRRSYRPGDRSWQVLSSRDNLLLHPRQLRVDVCHELQHYDQVQVKPECCRKPPPVSMIPWPVHLCQGLHNSAQGCRSQAVHPLLILLLRPALPGNHVHPRPGQDGGEAWGRSGQGCGGGQRGSLRHETGVRGGVLLVYQLLALSYLLPLHVSSGYLCNFLE